MDLKKDYENINYKLLTHYGKVMMVRWFDVLFAKTVGLLEPSHLVNTVLS